MEMGMPGIRNKRGRFTTGRLGPFELSGVFRQACKLWMLREMAHWTIFTVSSIVLECFDATFDTGFPQSMRTLGASAVAQAHQRCDKRQVLAQTFYHSRHERGAELALVQRSYNSYAPRTVYSSASAIDTIKLGCSGYPEAPITRNCCHTNGCHKKGAYLVNRTRISV